MIFSGVPKILLATIKREPRYCVTTNDLIPLSRFAYATTCRNVHIALTKYTTTGKGRSTYFFPFLKWCQYNNTNVTYKGLVCIFKFHQGWIWMNAWEEVPVLCIPARCSKIEHDMLLHCNRIVLLNVLWQFTSPIDPLMQSFFFSTEIIVATRSEV